MFGRATAFRPRVPNAYQQVSGLGVDDSQDRLRMSILPSDENAYGAMGWFMIDGGHSGFNGIHAIEDDPGHSTQFNELITDGDVLTIYDQGGGSGRELLNFGALDLDVPYFSGFTIDGTTLTAWLGESGGALTFLSATCTPVTNGIGVATFGRTVFTAEFLSGGLFNWVAHNAAYNQAQVEAQFHSVAPTHTTNILGYWKFLNTSVATVDDSGVGNTLTVTGTQTWTNISAANGPNIGG